MSQIKKAANPVRPGVTAGKTARAPGTPQHQAASGCDLNENAVAECTNSRCGTGSRKQKPAVVTRSHPDADANPADAGHLYHPFPADEQNGGFSHAQVSKDGHARTALLLHTVAF